MKTLKTLFLVILMSLTAFLTLPAQVPGFEWAVQSGGDSLIWGLSLDVDPSGNQIIAGRFRGTVDFDPDPITVYNITSNGLDDIFIQKLDNNGDLLWAAGMGNTKSDQADYLTTDANGNIYVTGYFYGAIDADPGPGYFELSQTKNTAFILKIEPDGDLAWAKQMGFPGDWGLAYGHSIAIDNAMNVITSGVFYGRVDFDPGDANFFLTANSGYGEGFIQKLDNNGNFIWAKQLVGAEYKNPSGVVADASGVYIIGWFKGTVDFNPDKKLKYNLTSYGDYDAFIMKLTPAGAFSWAGQVGGPGQDLAYSLVLGSDGYLYCTGYFYGTADFNPKAGVHNLTSFGMGDSYIIKLDPSGNLAWANQYGGTSSEAGHAICRDASDQVYMTGYFRFTSDFDPSPSSTFYLTSNGTQDAYICKTDPDGNFVWATHLGNPGWQVAFDVEVDGAGNIFNTGVFLETVDFDPGGNGEFFMTNLEGTENDMYLLKLDPTNPDNCIVPFGLSASDITTNSATLGWNEISGESYYVKYRETNGVDWSYLIDPLTLPTVALENLVPLTAYEFRVKTGCQSNYSYSFIFITLGDGCPDNYEPNESIETAPTIPVNTDISALIGISSDIDYFRFTTTGTAKNIYITMTSLPANYNIILYKSDGSQIGSSLNPGLADEAISYNTNKTGTYYVRIYGVGGVFDPADCYLLHVATSSSDYKSAGEESLEGETDDELTVYPNPSNSTFNFIYKTNSLEPITLQLFDISGRLVQEIQSIQPNEIITAGETLEYGIYVAVVTQGTIKKFVKIAKVQ